MSAATNISDEDRPAKHAAVHHPRRGVVYLLALFCVRFPFLSAALFGVAAAAAAASVLPIPDAHLRELAASIIGVVSYLGWDGATRPSTEEFSENYEPVAVDSPATKHVHV